MSAKYECCNALSAINLSARNNAWIDVDGRMYKRTEIWNPISRHSKTDATKIQSLLTVFSDIKHYSEGYFCNNST